jgi:hypothetical protein
MISGCLYVSDVPGIVSVCRMIPASPRHLDRLNLKKPTFGRSFFALENENSIPNLENERFGMSKWLKNHARNQPNHQNRTFGMSFPARKALETVLLTD